MFYSVQPQKVDDKLWKMSTILNDVFVFLFKWTNIRRVRNNFALATTDLFQMKRETSLLPGAVEVSNFKQNKTQKLCKVRLKKDKNEAIKKHRKF